jgi:ankyrin repeat protein
VWPGNGNVPLARLLIGRGATYDLTVASALNDLAAVRSMLDAAPSRISEQRPDDRRPLSAAAEFGHLDIVRLLLERGADPRGPTPIRPNAAPPCLPRRGVATGRWSNCC